MLCISLSGGISSWRTATLVIAQSLLVLNAIDTRLQLTAVENKVLVLPVTRIQGIQLVISILFEII